MAPAYGKREERRAGIEDSRFMFFRNAGITNQIPLKTTTVNISKLDKLSIT
jgi:hypothetical protein